MHDLEFAAAVDTPQMGMPHTFKNDFCAQAADAYRENLYRAHSLILVPGYAYLTAEDWTLMYAEACRRNPASANDPNLIRSVIAEIQEEVPMRSFEDFKAILARCIKNCSLVCKYSETLYDAYNAILQSVIIRPYRS